MCLSVCVRFSECELLGGGSRMTSLPRGLLPSVSPVTPPQFPTQAHQQSTKKVIIVEMDFFRQAIKCLPLFP